MTLAELATLLYHAAGRPLISGATAPRRALESGGLITVDYPDGREDVVTLTKRGERIVSTMRTAVAKLER